jgi:hypothetical protein
MKEGKQKTPNRIPRLGLTACTLVFGWNNFIDEAEEKRKRSQSSFCRKQTFSTTILHVMR